MTTSIFPSPDNGMGYTSSFLKKEFNKINAHMFGTFVEWMQGKTVGLTPYDECVYYEVDVERFLNRP